MHILIGIRSIIPKFFLEIEKSLRDINNSVLWWYWMSKERKIEEVYQIKPPWKIYFPDTLPIDSICAKEPLKLRDNFCLLINVCLSL